MEEKPPTLTERRKAATQLELARAAARLFTDRGPDATTAEEIAAAGGVALRTFYRYFRTKEDAVAPLLSVGAEHWRALLAASDRSVDLLTAVERTIAEALTPPDAEVEGVHWTRGLLRAGADDPALMNVWYRVNRESETKLRGVILELGGPSVDETTARLVAAAATDAIRIALEAWAETDDPELGPGSPAERAVQNFRRLSAGLSA
ncbi:AcrR family transcriptional regulator [Agromyces hippuratus]|uniref:AcrR family transcriptional regulator n=1 Tax=Agromyces hippuratus TaxID=286438 RepID=A0A852X3K5_9MICO|nr:TetR family transcriptional regulator [Agromyces hippuratus]NYG22074.1 AcrR family transcriptional regulator [Agromyces hippuratus]